MRKNLGIGKIIIYIILILWGFTTIFPFVWVILNSFKPSAEVILSSFSLPKEFTWENYQSAFDSLNLGKAYLNSFIMSGSVTIGVMLLSSLMAFAMTRYSFRGRNFVNSLLVASLMFPVFSTIIPVAQLMARVGWHNHLQAVILPQIAGNLSFAAIVMIGFLKGIPLEMEEAAYMEGANVFQVYGKIVLPLCKSSLATVAIFSFLWSYNDLFVQIIMLKGKKRGVCALMDEITSKYGTNWGFMAASVTLIVVPVLIVYFCLQKNIIKGLTAGAIKG